MFVDASAIVAILIQEPDAKALADRLQRASAPITSPIAIYEAAAAVARHKQGGIEAARRRPMLLASVPIAVVPVALADADEALGAFARCGKGQGHPAQLNMAGCFAYAAARNHHVPLLFKGDDFSRTDITAGP